MSIVASSMHAQLLSQLTPPPFELCESVRAFNKYNTTLCGIWEKASLPCFTQRGHTKVHGEEVMRELRSLIPIEDLRAAGSFFTGDELADEAVLKFAQPISATSRILDPTCGAGNLLIACSRKLPIKRTLKETIRLWGKILFGWDVFPEFIETTKIRLVLEAINRGCNPNGETLEELKYLLSNIRCTNALSEINILFASHIIMNPPFGRVQAPEKCSWAGGKVNAAGIFFEHIVTNAAPKASLVSILPEVLRSGTRYESWRNFVDETINCQFQIAGRFDNKTDVDVFLLSGTICSENRNQDQQNWVQKTSKAVQTVEDVFSVSVGPVVPHRDPEDGSLIRYIYPRMLPKWQEVETIEQLRRFSGRVFNPPFVVIRRTSSPADKHRAVSTLIKGDEPVAVENHLIIAVPNTGGLTACRDLMHTLHSSDTDTFLNQRIRCRHLTVTAIKEIPLTGVL